MCNSRSQQPLYGEALPERRNWGQDVLSVRMLTRSGTAQCSRSCSVVQYLTQTWSVISSCGVYVYIGPGNTQGEFLCNVAVSQKESNEMVSYSDLFGSKRQALSANLMLARCMLSGSVHLRYVHLVSVSIACKLTGRTTAEDVKMSCLSDIGCSVSVWIVIMQTVA